MLTREQIIAADDLKREVVSVPEWGGEIWVREATAEERDAYTASLFRPQLSNAKADTNPDLRNAEARLVVKCVIDEDGERIFSDNDADALGKKSARVIRKVSDVIRRLSGMRAEDLKSAEKNSDETASDSSPSS